MTRRDAEQRPTRWDREVLGFRIRFLDLVHDGRTFLRRRGLEHVRLGGLLVHFLDGPDPGIDTHDHPWEFATFVLWGGYTEIAGPIAAYDLVAGDRYAAGLTPEAQQRGYQAATIRRTWRRWSFHRMPLGIGHRIVAVEPHTITLVVRRPKVRAWGFFLPDSWVPWEHYDYAARRPSSVRSNRPGETRP